MSENSVYWVAANLDNIEKALKNRIAHLEFMEKEFERRIERLEEMLKMERRP